MKNNKVTYKCTYIPFPTDVEIERVDDTGLEPSKQNTLIFLVDPTEVRLDLVYREIGSFVRTLDSDVLEEVTILPNNY